MSYKAILFNSALRTLHTQQPTEGSIIIRKKTDDNKKLFEIKINNGKTEPEYCERTSLQTVTVFMYSILFSKL